MLRALIFILLPLFATGCLPEEESDDIVNDQGETVSDPTLRLNGMWNGQLDQAGALRVLMYNGTVFAFDESVGFYGTVALDDDTATAELLLSAYDYTSSDTGANQYVAGGAPEDYVLSGLLYPTQNDDDTLVGDYDSDTAPGGFALRNDGTWDTNSRLATLKGKWTSSGYELYLTEVADELSFREVSVATPATGCTTRGTIRILNEEINLYTVQLTERKNCPGFNVTNAPGYASVNANGELELFLRKGEELLYARYTSTSASGTTTDTTGDGTGDTTEETTEEETTEAAE
jgi:hypothetical protein